MNGVAATLLAFVLALRIIAAPIILSSPVPGLMAICSGGEVVYISLKDGQPVDEGEGPTGVSCPFFSVLSALPGVESHAAAPIILAARYDFPTETAPLRAPVQFRDYQPRAPPLLS